MSGSILLPGNNSWQAATWVYDNVREEVLSSPLTSPYLKDRFSSGPAEHYQHLDIQDISADDLVILKRILSRVHESMLDGIQCPDSFQLALRDRFADLLALIIGYIPGDKL